MWTENNYSTLPADTLFDALVKDLSHLLSKDDHPITTLANAAAFIFSSVEQINWAGFYLFDGKQLYLGPFGGKPACTTIAIGSGVCGTAAAKKETVVVEDVDAFPGHIVCDGNSRSEIVVPLLKNDGSLYGVLDIDSPVIARFGEAEKKGFEKLAVVILEKIDKTAILL